MEWILRLLQEQDKVDLGQNSTATEGFLFMPLK